MRILQEAATGQKTQAEVCRDHEVNVNTFYIWKSKSIGPSFAQEPGDWLATCNCNCSLCHPFSLQAARAARVALAVAAVGRRPRRRCTKMSVAATRQGAVALASNLGRITIAWMVVEALGSIFAGLAASSVLL